VVYHYILALIASLVDHKQHFDLDTMANLLLDLDFDDSSTPAAPAQGYSHQQSQYGGGAADPFENFGAQMNSALPNPSSRYENLAPLTNSLFFVLFHICTIQPPRLLVAHTTEDIRTKRTTITVELRATAVAAAATAMRMTTMVGRLEEYVDNRGWHTSTDGRTRCRRKRDLQPNY
jgi:hypothetical protein